MTTKYLTGAPSGGSMRGKIIVFFSLVALIFFGAVYLSGSVQIVNEQRLLHALTPSVITVADSSQVDPKNQGKIVSVSGILEPGGLLQDDAFGISTSGVKLVRKVEIYQRVESMIAPSTTIERDGLGRPADYSGKVTTNEWVDAPVDTRPFRHAGHLSREEQQKNVNEGSTLFFTTHTWLPQQVQLGAYRVAPMAIQHADWSVFRSYRLELSSRQWPEVIQAQGIVKDHTLYLRKQGFSEKERSQPDDYAAQIGDLRLRWFLTPPRQEATVLAQLNGDTLDVFVSAGRENYVLMQKGHIDMHTYLTEEQERVSSSLTTMNIGFFLMFWGTYAVMLWGIRFGTRQSALWEGWMQQHKYASSALLAGLTTCTLYSAVLLYQSRWSGLVVLLFCGGLVYFLGSRAWRKGHSLVADEVK